MYQKTNQVLTGDRVFILEGSSYGHHGVVTKVASNGRIRVKRDDGVEVDVPALHFEVVIPAVPKKA